ncbi:MAG: hypothetical protein ACK4SY_05595 [Pyrobaculum sp.]
MDTFGRGIWGSLAAAVLIMAVLFMPYGLFHPAALAIMSILVVIAVYVYANFRVALGERWFNALGPPVIGLAAVGVVLLWAGRWEGAVAIAAAYFGEPFMGYFIYRRLREKNGFFAILFLASAAAYAYTLPLVLWGLWAVPAAANLAKLVALTYFVWR